MHSCNNKQSIKSILLKEFIVEKIVHWRKINQNKIKNKIIKRISISTITIVSKQKNKYSQ